MIIASLGPLRDVGPYLMLSTQGDSGWGVLRCWFVLKNHKPLGKPYCSYSVLLRSRTLLKSNGDAGMIDDSCFDDGLISFFFPSLYQDEDDGMFRKAFLQLINHPFLFLLRQKKWHFLVEMPRKVNYIHDISIT